MVSARSKRMSRYIDAEPLEHRSPKLRALIKEQPTADVVEVRHGHWEQQQPQYRLYKCSACSKVCFAETWGDETVLYDYCPNCGAKMDEGE